MINAGGNVIPSKAPYSSTKIITFSTNGPPHDKGLDLRPQLFVVKHLIEELGYELDVYTPERVRQAGMESLVREHDPKFKLERNPGYHAVGFGAWKAFIILNAMSNLNWGDRVFYIDCDISKYPVYRDKISNIGLIITYAESIGELWFFGRRLIRVSELIIIRAISRWK